MDILIYWIQWAGKGTQSKKILDYFGDKYAYFEAWSILRAIKSKPNHIWNYVKNIIDKWGLVDDELISSFYDAFLITLNKNQYMLLDGYPRKLWQMFMFLERNKKLKRDFIAIYLDLSEEEAIKRLSWRRICKNCASVYNVYTDEDVSNCLKCWWELYIREDDKPDIIKKRIKLFYNETKPVIDFFDKMDILYKVDASKGPNEVFNQILNLLNKLGLKI